jgi:hypothetical protein
VSYAGEVIHCLVLVLCLAATASAAPPRELVASWAFEDGGHDSSGNGHEVVLRSGARIQGGSLHLDGEDDAAEVRDHPDLNLRGPLTLAARVRPDSVRGRGTILNKWYALDSYMLLVEAGHYTFSLAWPGGRWGTSRFVKAPARPGRWAEVVGTWDGHMMRLYVDGVLQAGAQGIDEPLQASGRPVSIGNHPDWNAFRGAIDEVRIYRGAVPEEEIPDLFDVVDPPEPEPEPEPEAPEPRPAPEAPKSWMGGGAGASWGVRPAAK